MLPKRTHQVTQLRNREYFGQKQMLLAFPCARLVFLLVLLFVSSSHAANQTLQQNLQWLGIEKAVELTNLSIDNVLNNLSVAEQLSETQTDQLRTRLQRYSGNEALRENILANLASYSDASSLAVATLLKSELVQRVRNFDVALDVDGAYEKLAQFQARQRSIDPERKQLLESIDRLNRQSLLAAIIQTELEVSAELLAAKTLDTAKPDFSPDVIADRTQQRQQQLATLAFQLNDFSYQFMPTVELAAYVELLKDPQLQDLLLSAERALLQGLTTGRALSLQ